MQDHPKGKRWTDIALLVLVLAVIGATAWYFSQYDEFSRDNLRAFIRRFGPWAPVVYAAVYVVSSPVPLLAPVISAAGGLLFGTGMGTLYTIVVVSASALVPFTLARRLGREWVESKLHGRKLDAVYQQSGGGKGFMFILVMRLIPILPWEVQNYVAGLTKVSIPTFILATIVGIIPGTFAFTLLGSAAADTDSWQFAVAVALVVLMMVVVPIVAVYLRKRRN
jgi:uncharacterized membrane protein YdjX (TVP38/TMEM64 family)